MTYVFVGVLSFFVGGFVEAEFGAKIDAFFGALRTKLASKIAGKQ